MKNDCRKQMSFQSLRNECQANVCVDKIRHEDVLGKITLLLPHGYHKILESFLSSRKFIVRIN